jgi:hypothetical protein
MNRAERAELASMIRREIREAVREAVAELFAGHPAQPHRAATPPNPVQTEMAALVQRQMLAGFFAPQPRRAQPQGRRDRPGSLTRRRGNATSAKP